MENVRRIALSEAIFNHVSFYMPCAGKQIHLKDSSLVPIKIFLARRNKKESLICKNSCKDLINEREM